MFRHIRLVIAIAALAIAAGTTPGMMAAQGPAREAQPGGPGQPRAGGGGDITNDVYIVQLSDAPVLSYAGGIAGRAATRPVRQRQKLDTESGDVAGYAQYLDARHDEALARAGGRKLYSYRYSFNGFAARLSAKPGGGSQDEPGRRPCDQG